MKEKSNPLKENFGKLKEQKPRLHLTTDQLLEEIDKELDPESDKDLR